MFGLMNGMVMQRNREEVCEVYVHSWTEIRAVSYCGMSNGDAAVQKIKDGIYCLSGIPVGGPYTVDVDDEVFREIYVGDVWILAGQSNMQGLGWLEEEDKVVRDEDIRALFMQDEWAGAKEPLHEMWNAKDKVHTEFLNPQKPVGQRYQGVGPGISFAREMKRLTGVPQGLICCAHGGTTMDQWSEKRKEDGPDRSLYAAMLRKFEANGSHVKGMFWFQGCSEAIAGEADLITERMKSFMEKFHKDVGNVPTVQVQISVTSHAEELEFTSQWNKVREAQRVMPQKISNLYTISAMTKTLDDVIHLSRESQMELGLQAADAMYQALYGTDENGFLPPLDLEAVGYEVNPLSGRADIIIRIKNVKGKLESNGVPTGFFIGRNQDVPENEWLIRTSLQGDSIRLRTYFGVQHMKEMYVYYGYGVKPYCNIKDSAGRDLPAFGPIRIEGRD